MTVFIMEKMELQDEEKSVILDESQERKDEHNANTGTDRQGNRDL